MLKINHTAYPPSRMAEAQNTIKEGGLWYSAKQEELAREAREILNTPIIKRKDEFKEFAHIFWIVVGTLVAGFGLLVVL